MPKGRKTGKKKDTPVPLQSSIGTRAVRLRGATQIRQRIAALFAPFGGETCAFGSHLRVCLIRPLRKCPSRHTVRGLSAKGPLSAVQGMSLLLFHQSVTSYFSIQGSVCQMAKCPVFRGKTAIFLLLSAAFLQLPQQSPSRHRFPRGESLARRRQSGRWRHRTAHCRLNPWSGRCR